MNQIYNVKWSETGLTELARIYGYPPEVKVRIYNDSLERLKHNPMLMARPIPFGEWEGYWARMGLYQVTLIFEIDVHDQTVWIDGVKHKRQDLYWRKFLQNGK